MGDLAVATEEIDIHTGIEPSENQDDFPLSPLPFPLSMGSYLNFLYSTPPSSIQYL